MDDSQVSDDCGIAETDGSDRLSELPDFLILTILSLLPMRDVVMTTILSKRWKDLWTTVPCLYFSRSPSDYSGASFRSFVCGALADWKGIKIHKFSISFMFDRSFTIDIDSWLHFAIAKQVEELHINLIECISMDFDGEICKYYAPQGLYSCSSIKKLSLASCNFELYESMQWNKLKSLTIESTESLSEIMDHVI